MLGWQKDIDITFVDGDCSLTYSFRESGDQWYREISRKVGDASFGEILPVEQDEVPEIVVKAFKILSDSDIEVPKEE